MFKSLKHVRGAVALLNPEAVRRRAERPVTLCLLAGGAPGYAAMEEMLLSGQNGYGGRAADLDGVFRDGDPGAPEQFDIVLCHRDVPCPRGAYVYRPDAPDLTLDEIVRGDDELALPLARRFPVFRKPLTDQIVRSVARENACFALATALPNVVPNLIELPWAIGEFASDTAFLTMNQMRMAFLVAAACGRDVGYVEQKIEILSIAAGALGWRAIARELARKIPLGGGLIPKAAIAWAGTYVIGKGIEHFNCTNRMPTRTQRKALYDE